MELLLYDFEGSELGFSDKVISSYREVFFNDIGTSEFHLELSDPLVKLICDNPYLILEQDGTFQDIIVGCKTDEDFTIYCRSLSWLLTKMIIPPVSISDTVSNTVSTLLDSSFGCDITLGTLPSLKSTFAYETEKVSIFSDILRDCLDTASAGHSVRFSHEDNMFYLDILKGKELSFYVSENDCTLEKLTLEKDLIDLSNSYCYLQRLTPISTWDPSANSPYLYNNKATNFGKCYRVSTSEESVTKFNLTWTNGDYIYCKTEDGKWKKSMTPPDPFYVYVPDDSLEDKYKWFHISNKETQSKALADLSSLQINNSFSASARNIIFLKDYNVGDFVKLQYTMNNTTKAVRCQISSVILNRDSNGTVEKPTLKEVK